MKQVINMPRVVGGSHIINVLDNAILLVKANPAAVVCFEFNGVTCIVDQNDREEDVVERYFERLHAKPKS